MSITLFADFDTRRDAELAVEHMVQEYGLDPKAITVVAALKDNSAGTRASGGDVDRSEGRATNGPALAGGLRVSVEVEPHLSDKVMASFVASGGRTPLEGDRPDLDL